MKTEILLFNDIDNEQSIFQEIKQQQGRELFDILKTERSPKPSYKGYLVRLSHTEETGFIHVFDQYYIDRYAYFQHFKHAYGVIESFKYLLQEQENQKTTSITFIEAKLAKEQDNIRDAETNLDFDIYKHSIKILSDLLTEIKELK